MKRSNFTFLFLFALLSFVSINLGAQATSSSCIDKVNISVDAQCGWVVNEMVLGATGPAAMAQSVVINGVLFPMTGSGAGFSATGSLSDINLNNGGMVQYELFQNGDGTGPMLCWGGINYEIKQTPDPVFARWDVMCSQPVPKLPKVSTVAALANGACSATISNVTAYNSVSGDACTGFRTIRDITGTVDIDGGKSVILLRSDTIVETPLDTGMVICPMGGPAFEDALELDCDILAHLGLDYPTPDAVFAYYEYYFYVLGYPIKAATNLAIQKAYPYVDKGTVWDRYIDDITPIISETLVPTRIFIDGAWVLVNVIVKDTTYDTTYVDYHYPIALPLPKGVTCNLSVKCTDMQFAGCAGPDSKIMRTWQVLDWCNGSIKECMQWIVVKPSAPYFTKVLGKKVTRNRDGSIDFYTMWPGGNVYVDIAPWTCKGQLQLSAMASYSCSPGVNISWSSTFGVIGSDNVLRELWLGETAHVTATAISDCGSHGEIAKFSFYVIPQCNILPVPIAEDQVNVSLTGDPTGTVSPDGGVAKVYVDAIDAGSHNAGCGDVDLCLLLKEELENPVYISGKPVYVNGHQIYHASGCRADGVLKGTPGTKLVPARPDIPYVYCKDFVKFCCADLGENVVALVATNDCYYSSHSWSIVNVEDKSRALFSCHSGATIACGKGYDPYDYAPYFQSAVCTPSDLEYTITGDVDACGNGLDIITWTLDGQVICTTKIYFDGDSKFNPYEIKWPKHFNGEEEYGVIRECELWQTRNSQGNLIPVLDSKGNEQYKIVEYEGYVYMGDAFDCTEGEDTGQPVWCQAACSLVGSSFEPLEVEAADACKKIIRKWTVIDWCTWDPNGNYVDDENDTYYDTFQAVDDEWLDAYQPEYSGQWWTDYRERGNSDPYAYNQPDGGYVTDLYCGWCDKQNAKAGPVYFRYTYVDWDGYYTFDQVIKVIDETDPVIEAPDDVHVSITDGAKDKNDDYDDCNANEDITASVTDMCGDTDLSADGAAWWIEVYESDEDSKRIKLVKTKTAFGTSATMNTQVGTQGDYHLIVWQVRDGCGNIGEKETLVYFYDNKQPTPVCIQDLSTAIMPSSGTVEIWAADYDNGSFDNCSDVMLWFLLDEDGNPTDDLETGTLTKNLLVTCAMIEQFGQGETLVLGLYVTDAQLNVDFCNITLNVNGAAEVCDLASTASIFGEIATSRGDMVESAEVALNVGAKDLTDVKGQYAFNGNTLSTSYEVKAQKNDDYMNGVSTLDLVLIQKHVIKVQTLGSAYDVIAADINDDQVISALDLVELRKAILGITDGFTNNSWRFVDATQQLDIEAPFPYEERLRIESLNSSVDNQNFIGVKIGDVSGNAIANSAILADNRSVSSLRFNIEDATLAKGQLVDVSITSSNFNDIAAYQFTMELNGLEFVGSTSGAIEVGDANFGLLDARTVTTAWFSSDAVSSSDELFTMTFRATDNVVFSDAFAISSRVTPAAAYTSTQERLDVALEYNTVGEVGFTLLQNTPNPFNEITRIGFELPEAGTATLTVFDVTGKTISVINNSYGAGYNEITVRKSDLGSSGVLYYQLESGDFTATRKMILID